VDLSPEPRLNKQLRKPYPARAFCSLASPKRSLAIVLGRLLAPFRDGTMLVRMASPTSNNAPSGVDSHALRRPRVGVPFRTSREELDHIRDRYDKYLQAIRAAGGDPVEISLQFPAAKLAEVARSLDAFVLTGSPADVDPGRFGAARHQRSAPPDENRERTDSALLEHAFESQKPVLAICYGIQSLNVFLGGSLVQDIEAELHSTIEHEWKNRGAGAPEPFHSARLEPGSRLARLAGRTEARVNSSHHQAVRDLGRGLRVTAWAPDSVIEAVEWTGDSWVSAVQWHPERTMDDPVSQALFRELVGVARDAPAHA
jgi:putative glutamine amidotransferase